MTALPTDHRPVRIVNPLRRDPRFRLYWLSRVTAIFGASISMVIVPVTVSDISGSAALTGLATSFNGLAFLAVGIGSGALADRSSRTTIMIGSDVLRAVVIAGIPVAFICGARTLWTIFPLLGVGAILFVFFDAANLGALRAIVGAGGLARASGALWSASAIAEIVGPMVAALALHAVSAQLLFLAESLCCVLSAICLTILRIRYGDGESPSSPISGTAVRGLLAGWRFVWSTAPLRAGLVATAGQALAEGMIASQLLIVARRLYAITPGSSWLGALYVAISIGALAASLLLSRIADHMRVETMYRWALTVSAATLAVMMLNVGPALLTGALAIWSGGYLLTFVGATTHRQRLCPDQLQGRVSVVGRISSAGIGLPAGAFVGGLIADSFGVRPLLATAFAITLATGILTELLIRTPSAVNPQT